jgi:hypothetical protein
MPAKGPDCAWLAEPDMVAANSATKAKISRLMAAGL